jgi:hypothetical protein
VPTQARPLATGCRSPDARRSASGPPKIVHCRVATSTGRERQPAKPVTHWPRTCGTLKGEAKPRLPSHWQHPPSPNVDFHLRCGSALLGHWRKRRRVLRLRSGRFTCRNCRRTTKSRSPASNSATQLATCFNVALIRSRSPRCKTDADTRRWHVPFQHGRPALGPYRLDGEFHVRGLHEFARKRDSSRNGCRW